MGNMFWNGSVTPSLTTSLNSMIKNNNGKYVSEKQCNYIEKVVDDFIDDLYEANEANMRHIEQIKALGDLDEYGKYSTIVYVFGSFAVSASKKFPVCVIFVMDYEGVVAKYKTKFEKDEKKPGEYTLYEVTHEWSREE